MDFRDISAAPTLEPPIGFSWKFLSGAWVLAPVDLPIDSEDPNGDELLYDGEGDDGSKARSTDAISQGVDVESDDSITDFERNLRVLLPGFQGGNTEQELAVGTRKSERPKKPSSRFTEDAGYLTEPPKSTKKKGTGGEKDKSNYSKPLFISEWSNVQIAKYCDTCGISFSESVNDCVNHIRSLEKSHSMTGKGPVVTPSGGCGN